ncbi:MAG: GntR family transcriptional regulator [Pseudomonadota bacterium]
MSASFGETVVKRRTSAEDVFRTLRSDIVAMRLTPDTKLSEVEIAKRCNVSRQPVREAFMRLGELNLLQIVPQKATRVRRISLEELEDSRFVRAALEVEVVRHACIHGDEAAFAEIEGNLQLQAAAVEECDAALLHGLDYQFHRLICVAARKPSAFKAISEYKAHTNRVCTLELRDAAGMEEVLSGHGAMFDAIKRGHIDDAVAATRLHLSHLDATIEQVRGQYPHYFED